MRIVEITSDGDFFHGTARANLNFRPAAVAYFTKRLDHAHEHARMDAEVDGGIPRTIQARLSIQNPIRLGEQQMQDLHMMPDLVARLRQMGHDAALGPYPDEVAVLDPKLIYVTRVIDTPKKVIEAQQVTNQFASDPRFETIRQKAQQGLRVWRGVRPEGPADPGDFGTGTYYSTSHSRSNAHSGGQNLRQYDIRFSNPIVLAVKDAYDLADRYGTVRGLNRQAAAMQLNRDLRAAGFDGLISVNVRGVNVYPHRATHTELELVDLRLTEAVQISGTMIAGEAPIVRFRRDAARIEASLPPVPAHHVRLWRGNRPGEIGRAQSFTSDLPGIALPFREPYGGDISYVDVPQEQLPVASRGGAPGVEFYLPREISAMARPVGVEIIRESVIGEAVTRQRFYHGSGRYFENGFVLTPQFDGYTNWPEVQHTESLVERYRPANALPRSQSVFMVAAKNLDRIQRMGGGYDYLYLVEPIDRVERNDLSWYSEIERYFWDDPNDPEARQFAENYWRGVRSPKPQWEYRARSARIVQLIQGDKPEWLP